MLPNRNTLWLCHQHGSLAADHTITVCHGTRMHAQEYRARLPAAESWRRYHAEREADVGDEDAASAWVDGATAALQSVRPDGVQSGGRPQ